MRAAPMCPRSTNPIYKCRSGSGPGWGTGLFCFNTLPAPLSFACRLSLKAGSLRHHTVFQILPQTDDQSPGHRYYGDAPVTLIVRTALGALLEPARERTIGLVAQPHPSHLDGQRTHPSISLLTDALVAARIAAIVGLRHQAHATTDLAAVVKLAPEQFQHQPRGAHPAHRLELLQRLDALL